MLDANRLLEQIESATQFIRERIGDFSPSVGVVLGSGLGNFVDAIDILYSISYDEIPHFPLSTVEGHSGRMLFGVVGGKNIVAMQGRFHYYEGYTMAEVTMPVRVMKLLGVETLLVSNAAGGTNNTFMVGDLMVITDHINLAPNPLIGRNLDKFGTRFPDMHDCYAPELISMATAIAEEERMKLQYGVYLCNTGPTFETQAEYRYMKILGGDAVGMSTVAEVIVARHASMKVFGVSVITNCGLSPDKGDHADVQIQGAKASGRMSTLFAKLIERLP